MDYERAPGPSELLPVRAGGPADPVDVTALVHQLGRAMLGAAALTLEVSLRSLVDSIPGRVGGPVDRSGRSREAVGVVLGIAWQASQATDKVIAKSAPLLAPIINFTLAPPYLPLRLTPLGALRRASSNWSAVRPLALQSLADWMATLAPATTDAAVSLIDVDDLLAKALARVNLQPLAETALAQLDLDDLLADVVSRVDVPRLVEQVLVDLDLTPIVERALEHIDLGATVDRALDDLDITAVVLQRIDLNRVIVGALEELDLTQLALDRVDLVRITNYIVEGIDLPELIRDSTRSVAAETVDEVRLQSVEADRAVAKIVARILRRPQEQP